MDETRENSKLVTKFTIVQRGEYILFLVNQSVVRFVESIAVNVDQRSGDIG